LEKYIEVEDLALEPEERASCPNKQDKTDPSQMGNETEQEQHNSGGTQN